MERRIVSENKLTTVFVVRADSTLDCSTDTDIKIFSTREKAKATSTNALQTKRQTII